MDKSQFRTCAQGSFWVRYRQWINRGKPSPWELRDEFTKINSHSVSSPLYNKEDGNVAKMKFSPFKLDAQFFKDSLTNECGIVRVKLNEVQPLHPRYELPKNNVITY